MVYIKIHATIHCYIHTLGGFGDIPQKSPKVGRGASAKVLPPDLRTCAHVWLYYLNITCIYMNIIGMNQV